MNEINTTGNCNLDDFILGEVSPDCGKGSITNHEAFMGLANIKLKLEECTLYL